LIFLVTGGGALICMWISKKGGRVKIGIGGGGGVWF